MKTIALFALGLALVLSGCQSTGDHMDGDMMSEESMAEDTMSSGEMDDGDMADTDMEDDGMMDSTMDEGVELLVTVEVLSGSTTPLAPVAWAVHTGSNPFIAGGMGMAQRLAGLEALAEDGDPSEVDMELASVDGVVSHGVAAEPDGSMSAGPATAGSAYSFTITATEGQHLSFATMYVQSNDLFYSPGPDGLALFDMSHAIDGMVTEKIHLYDAGTEVNERPGSGRNQAPRQSGPNTGSTENHPVRRIDQVDDGFTYPAVDAVVRVTVEPAGMM